MPNITVAFAGSGESTFENVEGLLNDFFGLGPEKDDQGYPTMPEDLDARLLIPVSEDHFTPSIKTLWDWTDEAGMPYEVVVTKDVDGEPNKTEKKILKDADEVSVVKSVAGVNTSLIDALVADKKDGRDVYLVLFWGEDGDENSETLLDLASSHDIPARDITAGLDDLSFDDEVPDEPEKKPKPEPEPEPEEKPRRRRRRAQQEEEEKPLQEEPDEDEKKTEPEPEAEERPKRRRGKPRKQAAASEEEEEGTEEKAEDPAPEPENVAAESEEYQNRPHPGEPAPHQTATRQDAEDVMVQALALKHEAKRKEVSDDIRNRTGYHKATDETAPLHTAIRKASLDFMHILDGLLPDGREKSLAFTNAEQAMMWANAAVARNGAPLATEEPSSTSGDGDTQEDGSAPKRGRGRPRKDGQPNRTRTAKEKAVVEIWNEETDEWERKGRGRVPKGAKTRLVDPKTGDVVEE